MNVGYRPLDPHIDWNLVQHRIGLKWIEDTKGIVAMDMKTNKRVAIAVFNNWTYSAVQIHLWIDNPMVLRHGFLQEIYNYTFNTGARDSLVGMVPEFNEEALKLNAHIGLKEVGRIPNAYRDDEAYVIMQGTREDLARWEPQLEEEVA